MGLMEVHWCPRYLAEYDVRGLNLMKSSLLYQDIQMMFVARDHFDISADSRRMSEDEN